MNSTRGEDGTQPTDEDTAPSSDPSNPNPGEPLQPGGPGTESPSFPGTGTPETAPTWTASTVREVFLPIVGWKPATSKMRATMTWGEPATAIFVQPW